MVVVLSGLIMLQFLLQVLLAEVRSHVLLFPAKVWFSGQLTMSRDHHSALSWGSVAVPLLNCWVVGA